MGKRILVVDDESHILHVLSMKLQNAGFEVVTAMDGEEALDICLAEPPDLLITDYQMPLLSGLDLCRELRKHDHTRSIPAIMLTARGFTLEPDEMRQAGIREVMAKPFSPREILEKVSQLTGEAQVAH
jgi:DNA-binding response OmpR family regulator